MVWAVERDEDGFAVVRMTTSKANQINDAFLDDLEAAVAELRRAPPRGAVFTGHGEVFSAGLDIFRLFNERATTRRFIARYEAAMTAVFELPFPTVAAMNGHTVAGGLVLALACDFRVAVGGSYRVQVDEVLNNVPFPAATMEIVRAALSPQARRKALQLGYLWHPDEACEDGVVDRVVNSPAELLPVALRFCRLVPAAAAEAYAANKAYLQAPFREAAAARHESYDGFVAACYRPETQRQFELARQRLKPAGGLSEPAEVLRDDPDAGVAYEVLDARHRDETVACLIEVWCGHNPMMLTFDIGPEDFRPVAELRVDQAVRDALSVVAVERTPERRVVGFFIWEDMCAGASWGDSSAFSPKFRVYFHFLAQLEDAYLAKRPPLRWGEVAHGIYGGVLVAHSGRRVTTEMLRESARLCQRRGFETMVTEATAIGSQQISYQLGWQEREFKRYSTYVEGATRPFASTCRIAKTPGVVLFELSLCRSRL